MSTSQNNKAGFFTRQYWSTFWNDLKALSASTPDPDRPIRRLLFILGSLAFPIALGALLGFRYAYNKISFYRRIPPTLSGQPAAVYAAMIAGVILIFVVPFLLFLLVMAISNDSTYMAMLTGIGSWLLVNYVASVLCFWSFTKWANGISKYFSETNRHGSAEFATFEEIRPYQVSELPHADGLYIGSGLYYPKEGHILTVAGTRGGKGVNIILPNLLFQSRFKGSFVVIDPKGENAAVSARVQMDKGQNVVLLNPWGLLQDHYEELGFKSSTYNPLDILKIDRVNLSDDIQMIAEAIVPIVIGKQDSHFDDRARTVVYGFLLYLVTTATLAEQHLGTLWEWLRFSDEEFTALLTAMTESQNPEAGDIIRATGNELKSLKETSSREFGSVISTARKHTDFLKSPPLRESLKNSPDGLNSADLSEGKTTVYVIIPADRLHTHAQWLRLVSSSLIRAVVRKPKNEVCFLLDEFYALGYLREIATGLGSYASYGVHLFLVLQNLIQLAGMYGEEWENFVSSCSVRHFFGINDNFTANYVANSMGTTSIPTYDLMGNLSGSSARWLMTPDELRRLGNEIIIFIDNLNPVLHYKNPYYLFGQVGEQYDENPYYQRSLSSRRNVQSETNDEENQEQDN